MNSLAASRCLHHPAREAASRCPSCKHFFCRECVVVFEDKLICASCLNRTTSEGEGEAKTGLGFGGVAFALLSFLTAWFVFYVISWYILQFRERAPLG